MTKLLFLTFFFSVTISTAQSIITYRGEKINELDINNKKVGFWKLHDHNNVVVISGTMSNDDYVSDIEYFQHGKLIAIQNGRKLTLYKEDQKINGVINYKNGAKILAENNEEIDQETQLTFFRIAEMKPYFYGGNVAMEDFISKNIDKSKVKKHSGKVKVKLVIDEDGMVDSVKVAESSDSYLNDEAVRVVKMLPRFQPGFQHGKFVRVEYILPVSF